MKTNVRPGSIHYYNKVTQSYPTELLSMTEQNPIFENEQKYIEINVNGLS